MRSTFNFSEVIDKYRYYFLEAEKTGVNKLPYYEIQQWDKKLNEVELRIFHDIKYIGVLLYPIFPISETQYLHFANPFIKVGIEIVYKNSPKSLIKRKLEILRSQGWTVYEIESTKTYHTFNEYCNYKKVDFDELNDVEQFEFYQSNKERNDYCLLEYMKAVHFGNGIERFNHNV